MSHFRWEEPLQQSTYYLHFSITMYGKQPPLPMRTDAGPSVYCAFFKCARIDLCTKLVDRMSQNYTFSDQRTLLEISNALRHCTGVQFYRRVASASLLPQWNYSTWLERSTLGRKILRWGHGCTPDIYYHRILFYGYSQKETNAPQFERISLKEFLKWRHILGRKNDEG